MRDLGPAEQLIAGAVGEPGQRRFYIQVTAATETLWFPAEKQQVAAFGSQALTLLAAAGIVTDQQAVNSIRAELTLHQPESEDFRVGGIQVAILESELIAIVITSPDEDESVRFLVAPEQVAAMATMALEAVAAGRPICPRCQLPMNPEGHDCPAVNGHHPTGA
jgi:uncharacterized repeat protein (TIGR03847 family)